MYAIKDEMVIGPTLRLIMLPSRLEHARSGSNSETHMYTSHIRIDLGCEVRCVGPIQPASAAEFRGTWEHPLAPSWDELISSRENLQLSLSLTRQLLVSVMKVSDTRMFFFLCIISTSI
jgi:hypothetical protein